MKSLVLFFFVLINTAFSGVLFAETIISSGVIKTGSYRADSLSENSAEFEFHFLNLLNSDLAATIVVLTDGVRSDHQLNSSQRIKITAAPGKHCFSFYLEPIYANLQTDSLEIEGSHRDLYNVYLEFKEHLQVKTCKPVIYLYPKEETQINMQVNIQNGKQPFFYPYYDQSWNITALPNGELSANDQTYRYLFWEATQASHLDQIEHNEGFIVSGQEAIPFLEKQLTQAGLNSMEQADFITFWGPQMASNVFNYVRFEWNEACDKFAELTISPKPESIARLYIFIAPIDQPFEVSEQKIPALNRTGFTVLEWGGQYSESLKSIEL